MDNLGIYELLSGITEQNKTANPSSFNNNLTDTHADNNVQNGKSFNNNGNKNGIFDLLKNFSGNLSPDVIGNLLTNVLGKKGNVKNSNENQNNTVASNPPEKEKRAISPSVNPLLSACKNHDDFVKRVLSNKQK